MEVFEAFDIETKTMFLTISIMDYFINNSTKKLPASLHLISVTSLLIASKIECIKPIKANEVLNNILHNKYTR